MTINSLDSVEVFKNVRYRSPGQDGRDLAHNYSRYGSQYDPSLEFRGKWNNPDLVLDDHGSLTQAFDPGAVLAKHSNMRPVREVVPLTLHEGSRSDFDVACAALRKK